jgi:hypothetical protein
MADIPGKYIREKIRSHYIELKADGSCFLFEGSAGVTGTYKVDSSEITISLGDSISQGKIQDGTIVDDEGEKWIRADLESVKANVLKCRNCGSDVLETAKFCSNCGAQVDRVETIPIYRNVPAAKKSPPTRHDATRTDDPLSSMTWLPTILRRDDFPWELIEAAVGIVLIMALFAIAFGRQ